MAATNQHGYYGSYPIAQNMGGISPNTNGIQTYQQQTYNSQSNQQQQQQHHLQHQHHHHQQQHQQQVQPYQHHQQVVASSIVAANQTQLTQLSSSHKTNSSSSATAAAAAALYNSIEATKSTKGASKLRRDLINTEIAQLRELLPLPASTRQRLSQLQLMALVLVYVRKSNYFKSGKYRFPDVNGALHCERRQPRVGRSLERPQSLAGAIFSPNLSGRSFPRGCERPESGENPFQ